EPSRHEGVLREARHRRVDTAVLRSTGARLRSVHAATAQLRNPRSRVLAGRRAWRCAFGMRAPTVVASSRRAEKALRKTERERKRWRRSCWHRWARRAGSSSSWSGRSRHPGLASADQGEGVRDLLPDGLDGAEAGPLMCAGITTFNALRNSGARAGDLVGVLGIGGLGHLGIQYAAKSGYRVVGVGRGPENAALAKKLGAFAYIDSKATKPAEELQKLGGAKVILATAPSAKAIAELVDGLSVGGKLVIVGAPVEPMEISVLQLLLARRAIQGWPSGTAMDSQETLQFSAFAGVR